MGFKRFLYFTIVEIYSRLYIKTVLNTIPKWEYTVHNLATPAVEADVNDYHG